MLVIAPSISPGRIFDLLPEFMRIFVISRFNLSALSAFALGLDLILSSNSSMPNATS